MTHVAPVAPRRSTRAWIAAGIAAALAVTGLVVIAPAQADPLTTGVIQGTVHQPGGSPAIYAEVTAYRDNGADVSPVNEGTHAVDASGHWSFPDLPVGSYAFFVRSNYAVPSYASGYSTGEANSNEVRFNNAFDAIGSGQTRTIDYTLSLAAQISGHATIDGATDPGLGMEVELFRQSVDDDLQAGMVLYGTYSPDMHGDYTINQALPSGTYTIKFSHDAQNYTPEFWEKTYVTDPNRAPTFDLYPGDHFIADASLTYPRHIAGLVIDSASKRLPGIDVTAYRYDADTEDWVIAGDTVSSSTGTYTLPVASGTYRVGYSNDTHPANPPYLPRYYKNVSDIGKALTLTVASGHEPSGISETLIRSSTIAGTLTLAPATPVTHPAAADVQIMLCPYDEPCDSDFGGIPVLYNATTGAYRVTGLSPGKYTLFVAYTGSGDYRDEYYNNVHDQDHATAIVVGSAVTVSGKNIMLDAGAGITGTLTDRSGDPVANYPVGAYTISDGAIADERPLRYGTTDADGHYSIGGLPSGSYAVKAAPEAVAPLPVTYFGEWYGGTYNPDKATRVKVTVPGSASGIDVKVDVPATIHGTITKANSGLPVADSYINVMRFDTQGGTYFQWVPNVATSTDENGEYSLSVPPGEYLIHADGDDSSVGRVFDVPTDVEAPPAGTRIDVAAGDSFDASWQLDLGGSYTGRVIDAQDGQPIEGAYVELAEPIYGADTDAAGHFQIDGLLSGPHSLRINADDEEYVATTNVDAPATTYNALPVDLGDIAVQRASLIQGTVRSATGAVLKDVSVSALKVVPGGGLEFVGYTESGPFGDFSLGGLPTGSIYLEFSAPGATYQTQFLGGSTVWSLSDAVSIPGPASVVHVDPRLVTGGSITGVVKNKVTGRAIPGVDVDIAHLGWLGNHENADYASTNSKGAYVFPGLEPGSYDVTFNSNEFGPSGLPYSPSTTSVIVNDRATTTLNRSLVPQSKVSGVVTAGGTGAAGIEVRATDRNGFTATTTTSSTGSYVLPLDTETWTLFFSDPQGRVQSAYWTSGNATGTDDAAAASTVVVTGNGTAKTGRNITLAAGGGTIAATVTGNGETDPSGRITLMRVADGAHFCSAALSTQAFTPPLDGQPVNDLFPLKNVRAGTYCLIVDGVSALSDGGGPYSTKFSGPFTVTAGATTTLPNIDLGDPIFLAHLSDATVVPGSEPSISSDGTPQVGEFLSVSTGTWTRDVIVHPVQWTRNGKPIAGAQELSYQLTPGDVGATIAVNVGATDFPDLDFNVFTYTATLNEDIGKAPAGNVYEPPSFTGKPNNGQTLTADPGFWDLPGLTFHYQWTHDTTPIAGATTKTYKLQPADVGATVGVTVTATRVGFDDGVASSTGSLIQPAVALTATKAPTGKIVGTDFVATPGTWSPSGATISYTWREYANDTGAMTEFATGPTTPVAGAAAADSRVTVIVTAAKAGYTTTSVEIPVRSGPAPVLSGTPSLTTNFPVIGDPVGADLLGVTASPPIEAADPSVPQSVSTVTYQWYRGTTLIAGATKSTYTPVQADLGSQLTVRIGVKAVGYAVQPVAQQVALQTAHDVTDTDFSGGGQQIEQAINKFEVGQKFTVSAGSWTIPPTSLSYQWLRRVDGASTFVKIAGATKATYTAVQADASSELEVRITAKAGSRTAIVTTDPVLVGQGILNGYGVVIPNSAHVGVKITATPGVWDIMPTSFSWQWMRNNRPISGATSSTYTPIPSDLGEDIFVEVVGHRAGYQDNFPPVGSVTVTVEAGAAAVPTKAPTLTVNGTAATSVVDGARVIGNPGTWPGAPLSFSYRWQTATSPAGPWTDLSTDYGRTELDPVIADDPVAFVADNYYRLVVTVTRAGYLTAEKASPPIKLVASP